MKFRIENKEAFQVIGITNRVTPIEMGEHPGVEQVWRLTDHDTYAELKSLNNVEPFGILHVDLGEGGGTRKGRLRLLFLSCFYRALLRINSLD